MVKTVNEIISDLRNDELKEDPNRLSQYLVVLSASLNQAGNFELDAEMDYCKVWEELKLSEEKITDKMVDMKAHQTEEYKSWQQMRIARKTIEEVIRAIKKRLANLQMEYHEGGNF